MAIALVLGERAQVVEDGAESGNRWHERGTEAGRLRRELLPPGEVRAARGGVGCKTPPEMRRDHLGEHERERQPDQQRERVQAGDEGRRARSPGACRPAARLVPSHQTKKPYVSRWSCSHRSHVSDHLPAARPAVSLVSVAELLV